MNFQRFKSWLAAIRHWVAESKPMIMCFLVIIAMLTLGLYTWSSEASIRGAGYILQLIGMIFAVRGLLSIRTHFGQPLLRDLLISWFQKFPKWKTNVVIGVGSANLAAMGMKARAEVWTPDDPGKSVGDRINALVENLD